MKTNLVCPKCGGTDYFLSERNVITGMGGIYGNRAGTKKFPVCKTCDEIMDHSAADRAWANKFIKIMGIVMVASLIIFLVAFFG